MLVFIASCKKEANVSKIPQIKLLSLSITELIQFKDSLVIEIEYIDGDGDIGEEDPDKNSIYVKDKRLNEADYYFIKPLSPPNSKIQIQGKVRVNIKNVFLLGSANQEFTNFEIKLRDKAGNWSNLIVTPEIIIKKE
ncbi:MAG: hypothetical protein Q8K70_03730 [Bacteroidota bacterium]|nr:hypothetical protein [Bacteroidota bacterium]